MNSVPHTVQLFRFHFFALLISGEVT